MSRRLLLVVVVAGLLAAGFATGARAQTPGERVVMAPAEGTVYTRFVFLGMGFTPGRAVAVHVIAPDGFDRRLRNDLGMEIAWRVEADGTFFLDFVPAQQFPDAPAGHWRALFCQIGSPTCQQLEFDVAPLIP